MKKLLVVPFLLLITLIVVSGCGGGGGGTNPPAEPAYNFTPSTSQFSVLASQAVNFSLTSTKADTGHTYAWTATSGTPDTGATAAFAWTAPAAAGQYTVKAVVKNGSTEVASKTWTVTAAQASSLEIDYLNDGTTPISGASVKVIGATTTYEGTTDASGDVTINSIPAGKYVVRFAKDGFAPIYAQMTLNAGVNMASRTLSTWADWNSDVLDGILNSSRGNFMSGVFDKANNRLAGVTVKVAPAAGKIYYMSGGVFKDTVSATDDTGAFFAVLPNGKYTLTASGGGHSFDPIELTVSESCVFTGFRFEAK